MVGGSGIVIIRYLTPSANSYGNLYLGATNTSSADLAEYYVTGDKNMEAGDVVTINANPNDQIPSSKGVLLKSNKEYDSKLVGVISTNPGVVLGSIDGENKQDKRMLALAGRVPVKIDPDSEPIEVGDFLTSSTKPGLAMKATKAGYTVGKALEAWKPCNENFDIENSLKIENCKLKIDQILAFVHLGYYMGEMTEEGFLGVNPTIYLDPRVREDDMDPSTPLRSARDDIIASASAWLRENWDSLSKTNTDIIQSLWVKTGILMADTLISPAAEIETLKITSKLLSPLVVIARDEAIYTNGSPRGYARDDVLLDVRGSATVSGTLYAVEINSPTIDNINGQYALINDKYASASAILAAIRAKYADYDALTTPEPGPVATISGEYVLYNQPVIITDTLLVNTSLVSNSINSSDTALYLQPTASAPINLLAGLMTLTPDGKVVINGDLNVSGLARLNEVTAANIAAKTLSVEGLTIASGSPCSTVIASEAKQSIWIATGSANPRNDNCDATASGTLNSNASIGTAAIASGSAEVKIENSKIENSTYIYLTPISDTANQVLFVKSKQAGAGFTVAVPASPAADIKFNYWLIQSIL